MAFHQKHIPHVLTVLIILFLGVLLFLFLSYPQSTSQYNRSQFSESENTSAGPSELFAEPAFTSRLPVAKLSVSSHQKVIPILMYHHVGSAPEALDKIRDDLTVPTESFQKQVEWLSKNNYHSVTLKDVYQSMQGKQVLPANPIVFTFDDGYDDVFVNAVPILKQYGFVGSFAVITKWPGTTSGSNTYATWDQIRSAMNDGMEIVSHTQTHFDGTSPMVTHQSILKELNGSKEDLNTYLGIDTNLLVYPYGHYNPDYIAAAKEAGFVMGVTVHSGAVVDENQLMEVPRIRVHGHESLTSFLKLLKEMTHV